MKRVLSILLLVLAATASVPIIQFTLGPDEGPPGSHPSQATGERTAPEPFAPWTLKEPARNPSVSIDGASSPWTGEAPLRISPGLATMTTQRMALPLPSGRTFHAPVVRAHEHANGDLSLVGQNESGHRALVTVGRDGVFARVHTGDSILQVSTDRRGSWLTDLSDEALAVDDFGDDGALDGAGSGPTAAKAKRQASAPAAAEPARHAAPSMTQIDVMFLYPPSIQVRYPGTLLDTRLNHLVAIANQALVDSGIRAQVRLTHHERTSYGRSQSTSGALSDLRDALMGETVPGLAELARTRRQYAADIVVLTWPHDIETRGGCGRAFLPQVDSSGQARGELGVQVTNDGRSNWSVCSDAVFAHELGHNLGALHQRDTYESPDPEARNFAWVRSGRWHTLMGSFGTGHVDRYRRLDVFSNPATRCAGEPCGSSSPGDRADNATHMNELVPLVANYLGQPQTVDQHPDPSENDRDGDGVPDRDDPYPFDPHDGDVPPQTQPDTAFSPRRTRDPQSADDWELLVVSSGNDRVLSWGLDGRFKGVVAEPQPVNRGPVLTGYSDLLVDGQGRLYLLASEDVRRFDRLSGRLIDVHLDSQLPGPRTLKSSFPRAMQWLGSDRLVVLGDRAIEVYDDQGEHLNPLENFEASTEPTNWNEAMALPLRAAVANGGQLLVAEAGFNSIMSFTTGRGLRGPSVALPGSGGLRDPRDMAIGPDGLLYVANGSADNVLRFDPVRRSFVDEFVAAGSGGLSFARALAFGPDGELYVASRDNDSVLRFDGLTGDYIEPVVDAGSGLLDSPESLVIAPVIDEIGPGHSGHYFVPSRSGEGWLLEILDRDRAAISWFTYPPTDADIAEQAWVVGVGEIAGNRIVFEDMLATRLTDADAPIESANLDLLPWGTLTLEFEHCRYGRAEYDSELFAASGVLHFDRLVTLDGLPCGSAPRSPTADAPGVSGQWSDPASNGQGWFLQELGDGKVFTAWFTYDENGQQAWVVGNGELEGNRLVFEDLVQPVGARFGADFDAGDIEARPWGRLEWIFEDCNAASASFESLLPQYGQGELAPERLTRLDSLDCAVGESGQ